MTGEAVMLRDHPLAGRIWDARAERFVDETEVLRRLGDARFILLGETHDNPEHHNIQTRLLGELIARGMRPALVMEQFDTEHQSAIDVALRDPDRTPESIAEAGKINRRGWEWEQYKPLVAAALQYDLPIVAANLSRTETRKVASQGLLALGEERTLLLGFDSVWTDWRQARLDLALAGGHCGHAPKEMVTGLSLAQRAKDGVMAEQIGRYQERGAVAILGRGHVRADIGVPPYLAHQRPGVPTLTIGLAEVEAGSNDPRRYAFYSDRDTIEPLYDLVWLTPQAVREDPCANFSAAKLRGATGDKAPTAPSSPKP